MQALNRKRARLRQASVLAMGAILWEGRKKSGTSAPEMERVMWGEQGATAGPGGRKVIAFPQRPDSRSVASVQLL